MDMETLEIGNGKGNDLGCICLDYIAMLHDRGAAKL